MTTWRSTGHKGDVLEELILVTNDYYKQINLARIDKIPTPVKVINIDDKGMIIKGFFEKKSTVDFTGIIQGTGIAFDVKETTLKSLPLQNIHEHQIEYMRDITNQGGLSFIIVHFKFCDEYYLIPFEVIDQYVKNSKENKRKSIPYKEINQDFRIQRPSNGILNYLPALNTYLDYKERDVIWANTHIISYLS